jgi:hypothetical protein
LQKVIEWGIHHGIREILLPQEIEGLDEGVWKPHNWHQFVPFVSVQSGLPQKGERTVLAKLGLPRLTLWTEEELVDGSLPFDFLRDEEALIPWQVALIPEGLRDLHPRNDRLFVDVRKTIQLSELMECIR